jgi:hypothetical protein
MLFRYYGFDLPQEEIVRETWGEIINLPAEADQILASLNRPWRDRQGQAFRVTGDTDSASPDTAVADLADNMPLLIGTRGHAMVLTSLTYVQGLDDDLLEVIEAVVRDPWPGRGRRVLSAEEWYAVDLLARIRVYPA